MHNSPPPSQYISSTTAAPDAEFARPVATLGQQPFMDRYSVGHATAGMAYASAGMSFWQALAAHGIWEAFESPLKLEHPAYFPVAEIDSPRNIAGDLLSAAIGWEAWRTVMGQKRTGGAWMFAGAAVWAATAYYLRWQRHPEWERPSWLKAAASYAGTPALTPPPPALPPSPGPG